MANNRAITENLPPQAVEEEKAVLGSMLISKAAIDVVIDILDVRDFYKKVNRVIFEAMIELFNEGVEVDYLTILDKIPDMDDYYITSLSEETPSASSVLHYANIVKDKSLQRQVIESAREVETEAQEQSGVEAVENAQQKFYSIGSNQASDVRSIGEILPGLTDLIEQRKRVSGLLGIPSGLRDLDYYTEGFQKKDMIVIAGRPGMGKSAFMLNVAHYAASKKQIAVGIISLEMSENQLANRLLAIDTRLDGRKIIKGALNADEQVKYDAHVSEFADLPIFIIDTPGLSDASFRAKARSMKRKYSIDMLIVDYMQLMSAVNSNQNDNSRVSAISKSMKSTAKELDIPVIAISQLSRAVENRTSKKPIMSDLRESGSIEQDADVVMFVFRPAYYFSDAEKDKCELIIAKQRNGPTGTVEVKFDETTNIFSCIDKTHAERTYYESNEILF